MQAVPLAGKAVLGGPVAKAVYANSERWGSLLASGGTAPLHVHMWSLLQEQCVQQVSLPAYSQLTTAVQPLHTPCLCNCLQCMYRLVSHTAVGNAHGLHLHPDTMLSGADMKMFG